MERDMSMNETHDLVGSDRVIGTDIYGAENKHIGKVEKLMLEKRSGRVSYAVLSFGGFLGMGEDYYPLPWAKLDYDETLAGFRVDLTKEQVEGAPRYSRDQSYDWSAENGRRIHDYYGLDPYI